VNRSTDLCTCDKDRDSHNNGALGHSFFPHPQPATEPVKIDVEKKVLEFLSMLGEVRQTTRFQDNDSIVLTTPAGDVWTMSAPTWRKKV
jgi:hypothetical protein